MMKNVSKYAAMSLTIMALLAQPAVASDGVDNSSAAAAVKDTGGSVQQKRAEKKYCADTEATGTRMLKRVCLTQRQWQDEGVDITAAMRK
jgi:hypothetical protein